MINYETSKSVKVLLKLYYSQHDTLVTVVEVAKPSLKNKITSNIKGLFSFLIRGFQAFVFLTLYILSILDYHHVHFQRFRHFSIIVTIFNREFWSVTSRNSPGIPLCVWILQKMTSYFWCLLVGAQIFSFLGCQKLNQIQKYKSLDLE